MMYAALSALLLVQASAEPVLQTGAQVQAAGWLAEQDGPIMHHGRDVLAIQVNCGGLGGEVCDDGSCKDDLVPVNLGGISTICRKPEQAPGPDGQQPEQPEQPLQPEEPAQVPQPEEPAPAPVEEPEEPAPAPVEEPETPAPTPVEEPESPAPTPVEEPESPAPTPVEQSPPSTGDFEFSGDLTYYGGAGSGGQCAQDSVPSGFTTVALNSAQFDAAPECGNCVYACFNDEVLGQGERCFEAIIDNLCPECAFGDLDLGEGGDGRWLVDWNRISCPSDGLLFSLEGSNAFYAKVKAQGGPASVTGMTCNGIEGAGTVDGFFEFNDGDGGLSALDCDVDFSDGTTGSGEV